jgi:hypothetical protein
MPESLAMGPRYDELHNITHISKIADLGSGKFDLECLFDRKRKPDLPQAIPAGYVPGGHFGRDLDRIFIENVSEYLRQPGIYLFLVHRKEPPRIALRKLYIRFKARKWLPATGSHSGINIFDGGIEYNLLLWRAFFIAMHALPYLLTSSTALLI